ncbi:hypothetical protein GGR20_002042 [Devosia subaequoris]|uniref:DUF2628 domain-containing protein n=1 Tax=Devosia subaequoris TaxID=395930 RepID=A0A7W6IML9_9HYPH|nr:hypothetical protein [Devosia subaequoris]MCP1209559.1 DUF2628 domain-containing protein [Devosia subaequoris]
MTLYAIFRSDAGALPQAVPEKFSWFAALLPPVHALAHRLWGQLVLFVLGIVALVFAAPYIGPDAVIWLYILLAIACGFAAPGARQRALKRRGLGAAGYRFAPDPDLARIASLETTP